MKKRILTMLLALVMVFSLLPTTASAGWWWTPTIKKPTTPKTTTISWSASRRSSAAGLKVEVTGAGLSGKSVSVDVLGDEDAAPYFSAIEAAGNTLVNPLALDIKIMSGRMEYQPSGDVQVAITRAGKTLSSTVYHFVEPAAEEEIVAADPSIKSPSERSVETPELTDDVYANEDDAETPALPFEALTSTTAGDTATVTTDHFSIYVIGETEQENRLLVKFMNGETEIESVYVKAGDVENGAVKDTVLAEPSFTPDAGLIFKGWTTEANYTTTTTPKLIEAVRAEVAGMLPPAKDADEDGAEPVVYYAMLFKQYKVTYLDPNQGSLSQATVEFPYDPDNANPEMEYTVDFEYSPDDENHGFLGWLVHEGTILSSNPAPETTPEGAVYKVGTKITISGDVIFSADAPEGHWLVFNENGKGGTYNAPQFVRSGAATQRPCEDSAMIRNGYRFVGWYKDEACTDGNEFTFGGTLDAKTTIYAKWVANEKANYTIIIWKQNLAGDGFDFEESITLEGNVGQNVSTVVPSGTGNDRYARVNGVNKQYTGFHLKEYDNPVEITPENNAVVNVYYDRNEYTLTFIDPSAVSNTPHINYVYSSYSWDDATLGNEITDQTNVSTLETNQKTISGYTISRYGNQGNRTYAIKLDGKWYQITANGRYVWEADSITSVITESNPTGVVYTITALYQQPIGDHFPIVGTNGVTYDTGTRWSPQSSLTVDGQTYFTSGVVITYVDTMTPGSMTFRLNDSSYSTKTMVYWVEALNGEATPGAKTQNFEGVLYEEYKTVTANYQRITVEDYIDLVGYSHVKADKGTKAVSIGGQSTYYYTVSSTNDDPASTVNFYYSRNHYNLVYMDGAYVDGNNNPMDEIKQGEWKRETNIAFGADVSDYEDYEPAAPAGFIFEGWYLDDTCTTKATFDKMPEGGMTVYAKWRQIQYRVFLHPQAGTDTTLDWGSDTQQLNFRISYDGTVSLPTGRRTGYEFYGWYTTPNGDSGTGFTSDMRLNASVADLLADYDKTKDFTDPMDKWGNGATTNSDATGYNGGDRFWITKKLDLYAKWGVVLEGGAKGIGVIYSLKDTVNNVDGSGTAPTDELLYKDGTNANAAPGVQAATTGWKFDHWVMQKWDGSAYVDVAGSVIYAGEGYLVSADNARIQTADGVTTYTIQLRASYVPAEEAVPTYIPWFKNDGSKYFRLDGTYGTESGIGGGAATLAINEAVTLANVTIPTRTGCTFLGWAIVNMGNTEAEAAAFMANTANYTQAITNQKQLYYKAGENGAAGTYYTTSTFTEGTEATQIAADEATPYQAMFAVWQEQYFYIFHSSTATVERVSLADVTTFDITDEVKTGYLYGGYYKDYASLLGTDTLDNAIATAATAGTAELGESYKYTGTSLKNSAGVRYWVKANAYNIANNEESGTAITPEVGDIYFLKEVPNTFLSSNVRWVYDWRNENKLTKLYLLTTVDDNCYSAIGFVANETPVNGKIAASFVHQPRNGAESTPIKATTLGAPGGYLGVTIADSYLNSVKNGLAVVPFWTTMDGYTVTATGSTISCKGEFPTNTDISVS